MATLPLAMLITTRVVLGSISQKATVSNPPVRSSPSENPPIPENRSSTRSLRGTASQTKDAIDDLAEKLTGDRTHFHAWPASTAPKD